MILPSLLSSPHISCDTTGHNCHMQSRSVLSLTCTPSVDKSLCPVAVSTMLVLTSSALPDSHPQAPFCVVLPALFCVAPAALFCVALLALLDVALPALFCVAPTALFCVALLALFCVALLALFDIALPALFCVAPALFCVALSALFCIAPPAHFCIALDGVKIAYYQRRETVTRLLPILHLYLLDYYHRTFESHR